MNITQEYIKKDDMKFIRKGFVNRIPELLDMRLNGLTLEKIAQYFGVTRERIRQQEAKGLEWFEDNYPDKIDKNLKNPIYEI